MRRNTNATLEFALEHDLLRYARAASAAGVSMLALTHAADAKVIYTKVHKDLGIGYFRLDLNHDGTRDFRLTVSRRTTYSTATDSLFVTPSSRSNEVIGSDGTAACSVLVNCAYALPKGAHIGPKKKLLPGRRLMAVVNSNNFAEPAYSLYCRGPWVNVSRRYLGLSFKLNGKTHYGWARLNATCRPQNAIITATLTGYAYESTPGKPIIAGDTGMARARTSLGVLAIGAASRKQHQAKEP